MLRDKAPGTFVVRDSNSFPGAFGLALKVATPPPGVAPGDGTELVRHFLIEPSPKGVKLKGCNNEPVFGSLSALVYQHSITPLALPTKLLLPEYDPATTPEHVSATQALLEQGAACNVAYIGSVDCESLTGSECVRRAVAITVEDAQRNVTRPVSVHFKPSSMENACHVFSEFEPEQPATAVVNFINKVLFASRRS
ncbi:SH2 domain protein [Cooperia oncophora]